ncbi:DUF1003 domain-containing protein [filamentous cyanobacterium CCP5]|nr:DUF1003 domain-containing protein [filamentous cyanobacterium CCP5]
MTAKYQPPSSIISTDSGAVYVNGEQYPLPEQVVKNIETVIAFQAKQAQQIPIHERVLSKIAAFLGKPQFLYAQLIFFGSWWLYSKFLADSVSLPLIKFDLQEMGVDVASLLIATGVLIQQSRQDQTTEQRSHLSLQINLLTEQKIAKLIGLIEELRSDLPIVRDRYDSESEAMKQATDPQAVFEMLQENLEQDSKPEDDGNQEKTPEAESPLAGSSSD